MQSRLGRRITTKTDISKRDGQIESEKGKKNRDNELFEPDSFLIKLFKEFDASTVGSDIGNLETVRWALRSQFDRNVVTHFETQV